MLTIVIRTFFAKKTSKQNTNIHPPRIRAEYQESKVPIIYAKSYRSVLVNSIFWKTVTFGKKNIDILLLSFACYDLTCEEHNICC